MTNNFKEYIDELLDKFCSTDIGQKLLAPGPKEKFANLEVIIGAGVPGFKEAAMGYEYPDKLHINEPPLPASGDFNKADNFFEEKVMLAILHELLHRQQSFRPEIEHFFAAKLEPLPMMSAELLVEADNYARTAQLAWQLANTPGSGYESLATYMRHADPKNHNESHYYAYARAMEGKPLTPENELAAMRAVVNDFLFASNNSQRYTSNRVALMWNYLNSGKLQKNFDACSSPQAARKWINTQPQLAGLGPDHAAYDAKAFCSLGNTSAGNILQVSENLWKHIENPQVGMLFMNDKEQAQVRAIEVASQQIRHWMAPVSTVPDSQTGKLSENHKRGVIR